MNSASETGGGALAVGDTAERSFTVTDADIRAFAEVSGDYNPLHADPKVARAGGFERPILHGLCSFGVSGWGLVKAIAGGDGTRLRRIGARFSSPVYPGETLRVEIWRKGDAVQFRTRVVERDIVVLSHGTATLG